MSTWMLHPEFHFRFRFHNSEGDEFGNHIVSLRFNFCVNDVCQIFRLHGGVAAKGRVSSVKGSLENTLDL